MSRGAMQTLAFWLLFLTFVGAFAAQVARRVRLIAAAPNTFSFDNLAFRANRFLVDVVLQRRTIRERPAAGLMHAFVFWGFVAFAGYTTVEFLYGQIGRASCRERVCMWGARVYIGD